MELFKSKKVWFYIKQYIKQYAVPIFFILMICIFFIDYSVKQKEINNLLITKIEKLENEVKDRNLIISKKEKILLENNKIISDQKEEISKQKNEISGKNKQISDKKNEILNLKKKLVLLENKNKTSNASISRGSYENKKYLGVFRTTFYTPYDGSATGITARGNKAIPGRTVAVDPRVIPLGSKLYIEGYGIVIADDTGSAIKGSRLDYCVSSRSLAYKLGVKKLKVWLIK